MMVEVDEYLNAAEIIQSLRLFQELILPYFYTLNNFIICIHIYQHV